MKKLKKPEALKKGDTIAIVTPSSDIIRFPKRMERSIKFLEEKDYKVKIMRNALKSDGYSAGTPEERADDINTAFRDDSIKAIIASTGGLTANAVIPHIDYQVIKNKPKIFCGYSDIDTLLLMITSKSNIITFHGPTLLPSLGEYEGSVSFTFKQFEEIVSYKRGPGILPYAKFFTTDNQYWDKEDNKKLKMIKAPDLYSIGPKREVTGKLFGGNLQTFAMLIHEPDFFNMEGCILFLEEQGLSTDLYERTFTEIERKGIFDEISGLILAKPSGSFEESNKEKRPLKKVLKELSQKHDLPILANVDCGHTKPLLTFPLGVNAELDINKKSIRITEAAVV
jgi:muramoyltetrapeptide carboxypeptidase LdcA involved in peptidoglycan recycling